MRTTCIATAPLLFGSSSQYFYHCVLSFHDL
nr:MAG TPA: hypothetical protein [Caudoviricetes sp.]